MKKISSLFRQMLALIRRHRMWFFAPILLTTVILTVLACYIGPGVVMTFVYAGF